MKEEGIKIITENRSATFNYFLEERYEAGIVLVGTEIKSLRQSAVNIKDAYINIKDSEAFVINMNISQYQQGNIFNHHPTRTRKLLLHKLQIRRLGQLIKEDSYTLIPTKLYFKKGRAKLEFALAKGKKNYDKRESEKEKMMNRQALKNQGKYYGKVD